MNAYFCRHSKQKVLAICIGLALLYAVPFFTVPGNAAGYIKIDGIVGESTSKDHKEWIDIENVQLAASRAISPPGEGGGRTASRPILSDVAIIKNVDKSSPLLFTEAVLGSGGKNAEIHLTRAISTGEERVYMKLRLYDILVSSLATSGSDLLTESVGLNYLKIEMEYTPYTADGVPLEPVQSSYDLTEDSNL